MPETPRTSEPTLIKGLGTWDAALLTIGSTLGTGIFLTTGDIARVLPHSGLILSVWIAGGLLTLAGALTYAELGAMFPRAGGQYHYLKEAYGPIWGYLFGWTAFFVVNTGGTAAMAVGFGEYLGAFFPFFSTSHVLWTLPLGSATWTISGGQLAGVLVIAFLSAVNYFGVKQGAGVQNVVTVVKVGSLIVLAGLGLMVPAVVAPHWTAPLPSGNVLMAFGVGMIAVLWAFDGWYGATASAGEMRTPERSLPLGLIIGTASVTLFYTLLNVAYVRTLPTETLAGTSRVAEAAASVLFGSAGARLVSLAVLISIFGCISSTILWTPRVYLPMAQDGLFFPVLARIHPRYRTPAACVVAQGVWAGLLTLSGTFEQLLHLHDLRGHGIPRCHGAGGDRPPADSPSRTAAVPDVGVSLGPGGIRVVVHPAGGQHAGDEAGAVADRCGTGRAGPSSFLVVAPVCGTVERFSGLRNEVVAEAGVVGAGQLDGEAGPFGPVPQVSRQRRREAQFLSDGVTELGGVGRRQRDDNLACSRGSQTVSPGSVADGAVRIEQVAQCGCTHRGSSSASAGRQSSVPARFSRIEASDPPWSASRRGKLLGSPTSMAFDSVGTDVRDRY